MKEKSKNLLTKEKFLCIIIISIEYTILITKILEEKGENEKG